MIPVRPHTSVAQNSARRKVSARQLVSILASLASGAPLRPRLINPGDTGGTVVGAFLSQIGPLLAQAEIVIDSGGV
jgi:hypothetical protein